MGSSLEDGNRQFTQQQVVRRESEEDEALQLDEGKFSVQSTMLSILTEMLHPRGTVNSKLGENV